MSFKKVVFVIFGIAFITASVFWKVKVAQEITKLDSNLNLKYLLNHSEDNRFGINEDWSGSVVSNSKVELKANAISPDTSRVEKSFVVESISGDTLFNLTQFFLVDRNTRHNLPNTTDINGIAYAEFPPHTQKADIVWWPATFGAPFNMKYVDQTVINGLHVYHFQSQGNTIDDTRGYSFLPLVPEKYNVNSSATINAYIEPITGALVDYEDEGTSYYVDSSHNRIWDISKWKNKLTNDMVNKSVLLAKDKLNTFSLQDNIIPLTLFIFGMIPIFYIILIPKKK